MKQQEIKTILSNPLFEGIEAKDLDAMLPCMESRTKAYKKGDIILFTGSPVETVGLVLTGSVQIQRESHDGRPHLLAELPAGDLFGEVFACANVMHSPVTVAASVDTEILHLNYKKVIGTCSSACLFHQRLVENMLSLMAKKNLMLNQKIELLSKRTTRERLLLFFDQYRDGSLPFRIPYSREALASYLCVDRSAMSAELSRMQKEGLIAYKGNLFEVRN